MISDQDLNTLIPASKLRGYLEPPRGGLMDTQGSEEIDFEDVTDKVTLLSVALTDITRQLEQEVGAGVSDLNAVGVQLSNLHAKIGEDPLCFPAAWASRADLHFVRCVLIQSTRVQHTSTVPGQKPHCRLYRSAFVIKSPLPKTRAFIVASCKRTGPPPTHSRFSSYSHLYAFAADSCSFLCCLDSRTCRVQLQL